MSNSVPSWEGYRIRKIPSSDSTVPEEEFEGAENRVAVKICKVCKQPLTDTASIIICAECGHYAHSEHSHNYQMAPYCNLCIIQSTKVDKRAFKVLYGMMLKFKGYKIKKAAHFNEAEYNQLKQQLIDAGILEEKKILILTWLVPTSFAHEVYPTLEEIYKDEKDVSDFATALLLARSIPIIGWFLS